MGYNPANEPVRPLRPSVNLDQNKWNLIATAGWLTPGTGVSRDDL